MTSTPVHVAVFDTWTDWEVGHAIAHVRRASWQRDPGRYEIVTVGVTSDPIVTMGGLRITPDTTLDEVGPAESAMLILAGGDTWADDTMQPFRDAARDFVAAGTPVAAICGATYALALAGLLDDRPHTSNDPSFLAMSGYSGGEHYVREPAVSDGTVITGTERRLRSDLVSSAEAKRAA